MSDLKKAFKSSMLEVANILDVDPVSIRRNEYVRIAVDTDITPRLSKRDLESLGGFKAARAQAFGIESKIDRPNALVFDIETAPMLGFVWGLWDNNVALNQIHTDWYVLSWAAKWLDSDEVMYDDQRNAKNIENDKRLLKGIWKLLDKADIVITQNGKKFDSKKLNARFILNGMKPPSTYKHIDTLVIAKKHFGFTSNKLAYMTDKLCKKYKKLSHAKFSGFSLWRECLKGNPAAWEEMEEYNRYDVLSLQELYEVLSPWDKTVDFSLYTDEVVTTCNCGSTEFRKDGYHYTTSGKFQRYRCKACGAERRDKTNLFSKEKRKSLKVGTR